MMIFISDKDRKLLRISHDISHDEVISDNYIRFAEIVSDCSIIYNYFDIKTTIKKLFLIIYCYKLFLIIGEFLYFVFRYEILDICIIYFLRLIILLLIVLYIIYLFFTISSPYMIYYYFFCKNKYS